MLLGRDFLAYTCLYIVKSIKVLVFCMLGALFAYACLLYVSVALVINKAYLLSKFL